MKKNLVFLLFILLFTQVNGRDFSQISKLEGHFNLTSLKKILNEEKIIYSEKNKHSTLLNIKYLESFVADYEKNNNKKLQKLLWIIENSREEDHLIYTYANYHLGSLLNYLNSNLLAKNYAQTAITNSKKYKIRGLIKLSYSLMASIYYHLKEFDKATTYYYLAFKSENKNDYLFLASMLNNISLCKMQIGDLQSSNSYIFRSIYFLNKIKNKTKNEQLFKVIVEGNLGSNYLKLKQIDLAKKYLENEVTYYLKNNFEVNNTYRPLNELIKIYKLENNRNKVNEKISQIEKIEQQLDNYNDKFNFTNILYTYYSEKNDLLKVKKYAKNIIDVKELITDSIERNSNSLNNILYSQEIKHLKNLFQTNQKLLEAAIKSKRNTTLFLIIFFSLVSFILILLYLERNKTINKNNLIQKQKDELEANKLLLLENEIKLKQEKITSLALNLNIKKQTEKAFLLKIKEIKRKRSVEIESVLIDLQQQVSNLLNIDNKNNETISDEENQKFTNYLKELHPNLNEQEVSLCVFFKLNLNAKEIASFTNMSAGTIRVYKSKIKDKMGLDDDLNLSEYLASLALT